MDQHWASLVTSGIKLQGVQCQNIVAWCDQCSRCQCWCLIETWSLYHLICVPLPGQELKADSLSSPLAAPRTRRRPSTPGPDKPRQANSRQKVHGALAGFLVNRRRVGSVSLWLPETSPELKNRAEEKGQEDGTPRCSSTSVFPELTSGFRGNQGSAGLTTSSRGKWQASLSLLKFPSLARE